MRRASTQDGERSGHENPLDDELSSLIEEAVDIHQAILTELESIEGDRSSDVPSLALIDSMELGETRSHDKREVRRMKDKVLRSGDVLHRAQQKHKQEHTR